MFGSRENEERILEEILQVQIATVQVLEKILAALERTPVRLNITEKEITRMSDKKAAAATLDFVLQDNGTVKFTANPVDALGLPSPLPASTQPLTWASSDPALTLSADPADTSGFNLSQIGTPKALATGVVVTCKTIVGGNTISGTATPVDIVAGGPTGFQVTEQ